MRNYHQYHVSLILNLHFCIFPFLIFPLSRLLSHSKNFSRLQFFLYLKKKLHHFIHYSIPHVSITKTARLINYIYAYHRLNLGVFISLPFSMRLSSSKHTYLAFNLINSKWSNEFPISNGICSLHYCASFRFNLLKQAGPLDEIKPCKV